MKRHALLAPTILAIAGTATSLSAQSANPLVGRWTVEFEVGRRIENGEVEAIRGKGTLSVAQSGDSLLMMIQGPARPDGTVPPPSTVGARIRDGGASFVQKQKVRMNIDGAESIRDVTLMWTLMASGDTLTGTLARSMPDGLEMGEASPVTGTRVKS